MAIRAVATYPECSGCRLQASAAKLLDNRLKAEGVESVLAEQMRLVCVTLVSMNFLHMVSGRYSKHGDLGEEIRVSGASGICAHFADELENYQ